MKTLELLNLPVYTNPVIAEMLDTAEYVAITGSRGYQCEGLISDYDYQGFKLPLVEEVFQPVIRGYGDAKKYADVKSLKDGNMDVKIHNVIRFLDQLRLGIPNVVELLFLPTLKSGTVGDYIQSMRYLYVNKRTVDKFVSVAHAMPPNNYHHWRLRLSAYDLSTKGYIDYDVMGPKLRLLREEGLPPICHDPVVLAEPDEAAMLTLVRVIICVAYNIPMERL